MTQPLDSTTTGGTAGAATVGQLMHPATTTVERHAHIAAAAYLMKQAGASSLVVTTDDAESRPLAILTESDISMAVADGMSMEDTRISDLVGRLPATVERGTPISEAAQRMISSHLRHLAVVDDGRLVGMLDISDACRGLLADRPAASPAQP